MLTESDFSDDTVDFFLFLNLAADASSCTDSDTFSVKFTISMSRETVVVNAIICRGSTSFKMPDLSKVQRVLQADCEFRTWISAEDDFVIFFSEMDISFNDLPDSELILLNDSSSFFFMSFGI